jgi:hypothetical protein
MREDDLFLEATEQHVHPAAPAFFDAFWREAEQRQRHAARRWRAAALALAAVAAAATSAAGVMASRGQAAAAAIDRTWKCTPAVGDFAGHPTIGIHASPKTPRADPFFQLSTRQSAENSGSELGVPALHFDTSSTTVTTDPQLCKQVRAKPAFSRRGLVEDNVYTSTFLGGLSGACRTPTAVLIRAHITFAQHGAASAEVIVVTAPKQRPIAYFTWTRHRIAVWIRDLVCDVGAYPY